MNECTKLVVFDLDGTLVKSDETIYNTVLKTFEKMGRIVSMDKGEFDLLIGLHFTDMFRHFGLEVPDMAGFLKIYKPLYFENIGSSRLYPGVRELLSEVHSRGIKTALLTTKAQDQADWIVEHFRLRPLMDYVMGRREGIAHKPSAEGFLRICADLGIPPRDSIMVGDSEMDVRCAKNAGAGSIAVSYGYRNREMLLAEKPDSLSEDVPGILSCI